MTVRVVTDFRLRLRLIRQVRTAGGAAMFAAAHGLEAAPIAEMAAGEIAIDDEVAQAIGYQRVIRFAKLPRRK